MRRAALAVLLLVTAGSVHAIEFRLPDGTKVTGARVDRIEGNLAVVEYDGGVTTVPVADLPAALRPKKMPPGSVRSAKPESTPPPPPLGTPPSNGPATSTSVPGPSLPARAPSRTVYDSRTAKSATPAAPARGAARGDIVFDPLRGAVPLPTPPPSPAETRRAVPDPSGRVVVTAESVPYVDRFAEDEDNPTYKRYQENLLLQKKKRDAKDAPKDILDLPIFRYSPLKDPNKSAFQSPVTPSENQFSVPNYMKPDNYIDDPYKDKK